MNPVSSRAVNALKAQQSLASARTSESVSGAEDASRATDSPAAAGSGSMLRALDNQSRQRALSGSREESATPEDSSSPSGEVSVSEIDAAGVNIAIALDTSGLEAAKSAMQNNLADIAADPEAFHAAMEKSFGSSYDKAEAETIRQQVLEGDFSWMPNIQVVDESVLQDQSGQQGDGSALGAYSKDNDTIYISQQLLDSDPDKAIEILTEEVGHGLDVRLNTSDAAGDEGDIFAKLVGGEEISDSELTELRSENDSGTIIVDGKEVEVEYGFLSKAWKKVKSVGKSIVDGVKDVAKKTLDGIKDVAKKTWDGIKSVGKKILESKLIGQIMMVAQFIPIPIVQLVAKGYSLIKAAYQVGVGIKNGSIGMILGGVAGVAGGAAGLGKALGASASFVKTATTVANGARTAGAAYTAVAEKNFAAAAGLASQAFGGKGTDVGRAFGAAQSVATGVEQYKSGDVIGALSSGRDAYNGLANSNDSAVGDSGNVNKESSTNTTTEAPSTGLSGWVDSIKGSKTYQAISENVTTIRSIVDSVKDGDIQAASSEFLGNYGDDLGISPEHHEDINKWAGVIDQVYDTAEAVSDKKYSSAIGQAADLLGIPMTAENQQRLDSAFKIRGSVLENNYSDAFRNAAALSNQSGQEGLATNLLNVADLLDNLAVAPAAANQAVTQAA